MSVDFLIEIKGKHARFKSIDLKNFESLSKSNSEI